LGSRKKEAFEDCISELEGNASRKEANTGQNVKVAAPVIGWKITGGKMKKDWR